MYNAYIHRYSKSISKRSLTLLNNNYNNTLPSRAVVVGPTHPRFINYSPALYVCYYFFIEIINSIVAVSCDFILSWKPINLVDDVHVVLLNNSTANTESDYRRVYNERTTVSTLSNVYLIKLDRTERLKNFLTQVSSYELC